MNRPLIIDSFAGGGGASEGIRAALGRDPDYALNHNPIALAMHRINHPDTHHIEEDVWNVDAVGLCNGRPVGLLWMSPDCKHFSKAKGGKPREKAIRGLAWVGVRWIKSLPRWQRPRLVCLENVEEFQDWGPLLDDGRPCPVQKGATFQSFVAAFKAMGYAVEWRELRACDYGAPTIRKRLFLIARRDGRPIVWPAPTHGAPTNPDVITGRLKPWRTAAEIIDWSLPCPSIFETSAEIKARYGIRANRPLADATMARIAKGTKRYVLDAAKPFLVSVNHGDSRGRREYDIDEPANTMTASRGEALVTPFVSYAQQGGASLAAIHMTRQFGASVGSDVEEPVGTITAGGAGKAGVVAAFLAQHNLGVVGHDAREPLSTLSQKGSQQQIVAAHLTHAYTSNTRGGQGDPRHPLKTIMAGGNHAAAVYAFLSKYYGTGAIGQAVDEPAHTLTAKDRHGVVTVAVEGQPYAIVDIGMRMLTPRERFCAQGFRPDYVIDRGEMEDGTIIPLTLEQQGSACGNSVCPDMAEALIGANRDANDFDTAITAAAPAAMPLFAAE